MRGYIAPLLWSFLPDKITQTLMPVLTGVLPGFFPPAAPGSEGWRRNYRHVLTAVVIIALAYNFATTARAETDWYDLLGVGPRASDDELKKAFRQMSRLYHPDRLGPRAGPDAEARFIAIRQAYEVLTDPVKRFAYDRFGPSIVEWQRVAGAREHVLKGAQNSLGFYVGTVGVMLVLGLLGRAQQGAYWRNFLLCVLLIWETTLILTPTSPVNSPTQSPLLAPLPLPIARVLAFIIPRSILQRQPYQLVALLHRLFTDACIAISQLAAVWSPRDTSSQIALQLAGLVNAEAVSALSEEIGPVLAGTNDRPAAERNLLDRMEKIFLDRQIQVHPATREAFETAADRIHKGGHVPSPTLAVDESAPSPRRTRGSTPRLRVPAPETLAVAQDTPLPPSPTGTPGARRRSPRLSVPPS